MSIEDCVWDGPDFFLDTFILASCYSGDDYLENFFTTTLKVKNASFEKVLEELSSWTQLTHELLNISRTCKAYEYLEAHVHSEVDWTDVK